jgi:hypothetical protein
MRFFCVIPGCIDGQAVRRETPRLAEAHVLSLVYGFFEHAAWASTLAAQCPSGGEAVEIPDKAWYRFVLEFSEIARTFPAMSHRPSRSANKTRVWKTSLHSASDERTVCHRFEHGQTVPVAATLWLGHLAELLETRFDLVDNV